MQTTKTMRLNKDFKRLYSRGKSRVDPVLVSYVMSNRLGYNRIGITTSKKIGNAVKRNRARRIIREAYRHIESEIGVGRDIVFVARVKTTASKMPEVLFAMKKHLIAKKA